MELIGSRAMSFAYPSGLLPTAERKGDLLLAARKQSSIPPVLVSRPTSQPGTIVMALEGSVERSDIRTLCARARTLLESDPAEIVVCDVEALLEPDLISIDALAQLWLTARRLGRKVRLERVSNELQDLLSLVGLCDVLANLERSLIIQLERQVEQREEAGCVEEEADTRDNGTGGL